MNRVPNFSAPFFVGALLPARMTQKTESSGQVPVERAEAFAVDLSNCDREPIHILGIIQPFGFLVAVTPDWMVARVSQNLADFTGRVRRTRSGSRCRSCSSGKPSTPSAIA
jgi:hypothetical protein